MSPKASLGLLLALGLVACAGDDTASESDDLTQLTISAGDSIERVVALDETTLAVVTVDCSPPDNPDITGSVLSVSAPDLEMPSELAESARAGYWQWAGELAAGEHSVTLRNEGSSAAHCSLTVKKQTPSDDSACTAWTVHRSRVKTAVHLPVGNTTSGDWESLPASGNHWGAWAPWGYVYPQPVLRGFYLHNLEHGGAVLSYRCSSNNQSQKCKAAEAQLLELANAFGQNRVIVTPDPTQPTMFAVRTWRMAYASECLDQASALEFLNDNFRHGREDIDADVPIPFDPTTTEDVPCQDLMAAPDSC